MRGLRTFGLVFVFSTFIPFALGYTFEQNLTAQGMNGAVSCENKVCSQAGASMLKRGGNAADAVSQNYILFHSLEADDEAVDGCNSPLRGGYR